MKQTYKVLSQQTVYKSLKLQVDKAKIMLPNGKVVEWDTNILPSFYFGVPIVDGKVLMTKEWRLGPRKVITQFTGSRCVSSSLQENLGELARELKEEIGIEKGEYKPLLSFLQGIRSSGKITYFAVENFKLGKTERDQGEFQEIISLPIKGLYQELLKKHRVTSDTLLIAKLLEENYLK